jgi:NAD(P)-dependent dehydrogenase (short-subunit alcohol dehydrogenase family)
MTSTKPVWLITGCSTGFGRKLARLLLKRACGVAAAKLREFRAEME